MATFSVLMSVYINDSPDYLAKALKSIYDEQTRKPDEIVIVFDGPLTPQLLDVLDIFKAGKENIVKYYPQDINRGLGEALRIGSEFCNGDYIFRMDSDDVSESTRFEKQIDFIQKNPDIDVLGTDIAEFYNSPEETKKRIRSCPSTHSEIVKMGKKRNPMNHVSVCIKRSSLLKSGGYKTLLLLEDYYLWLRMIVAGCKFANINESLVFVRVGNGFDYKRGAKERISGWKVLQDYMVKNGMISICEARMNMLYIRAFVRTPVWMKRLIYKKLLRK